LIHHLTTSYYLKYFPHLYNILFSHPSTKYLYTFLYQSVLFFCTDKCNHLFCNYSDLHDVLYRTFLCGLSLYLH
jgi:hypothetical protein